MTAMTHLNLDSNLIWAAKAVFSEPDTREWEKAQDDLKYLLFWGKTRNITGIKEMALALDNGEINREELQTDFTRLFVNGFPAVLAHPFGGWYRGERVLFGSGENKVRQFYADCGVHFPADHHLPADHILVELEFLAIMLEEYQRSQDNRYLSALRTMIDQYMQDWVFDFLQAVGRQADSRFYQTFAALLESLLHELITELKGVA